MNDIEKALIEKCKNGDLKAFETLIESHQKKVFNLCYRFFPNYDDASELAQEVFLKVYKSIALFKCDSSFFTWIYKIATTTCIDELRKRRGKNTVSIDEIQDDNGQRIEIADNSSNPHELYEKNQFKYEIQNAINKLSEEYKTVIILRDIQGFSYEEISEIVGIPLGTVKSRIKRARDCVKEDLLAQRNFFKNVSSN